jgi:hypothetical protein
VLVLEEFGPDLQHIKGERNVVADALSRLEIDDEQEIFNISECFGYDDDDLPPSSFPLRYKDIAKAQLDDPALLLKLRTNKDFSEATFRGGDKEHKLICHNGKIASPPSLQQKTTDWCHEILCHPGTTRTEVIIRQHFDWKGLAKHNRGCLSITYFAVCPQTPRDVTACLSRVESRRSKTPTHDSEARRRRTTPKQDGDARLRSKTPTHDSEARRSRDVASY